MGNTRPQTKLVTQKKVLSSHVTPPPTPKMQHRDSFHFHAVNRSFRSNSVSNELYLTGKLRLKPEWSVCECSWAETEERLSMNRYKQKPLC